MQRIFIQPGTEDNLAAEQMQIANQTANKQFTNSLNGSFQPGNIMDGKSHLQALPSFAFVIAMMILLFFLVFHSHMSLAASVGVGRR